MGYVVKSVAVIGLVYLASPLRPPLPDWLARPANLASSTLIQSNKSGEAPPNRIATVSPSSAPSMISIADLKATMETATHAVKATCTGHEKTCLDVASHALKTAGDGDLLAALIGADPAHAQNADAPSERVAEVNSAPLIPLPPRRDPVPPTQKKI